MVILIPEEQAGLGQAPSSSGPAAMKEYVSSYNRAQAELDYLAAATASDWTARINDALSLIPNEFKSLELFVNGKTGNPDAERQLSNLWGTVHQKMIDMLSNQPGVVAQLADRVRIGLTDFFQGAEQAMRDYSAWAIDHAGPALKKYWQAVNHVGELEQNLAEIKASGQATAQQIADQQSKINAARSMLSTMKNTVRTVSGGLDLDQMAITEFGPFTNTLSWPPLPVIAAVAIAVAATLIIVGAVAILEINKLVATGKGVVEDTRGKVLAQVQAFVEEYTPWVIGGGVVLLGGIIYLLYRGLPKKISHRSSVAVG